METFNFALASFFVPIAIFFLVFAFERGFRNGFPYNIYNQTEKELLRDQFLASLDLCCALFCVVLIFVPLRFWYLWIPIALIMVIVVAFLTPLRMYMSALMAAGVAKMVNQNSRFFDQNSSAANLKWYELTPFIFIGGWVVYYLMYAGSAWLAGFELSSDQAPTWSILSAFAVGALSAIIATVILYKTFKNAQ